MMYRKIHQQNPNIVNETLKTRKPETPHQTLHENDRYTANNTDANIDPRGKNELLLLKESSLKRKPHCFLS